MSKTANAISPRRGKLELVVTAAMLTAVPEFGQAETVDISSVVKGVSGGGLSRAVNREYVIGDDTPISDYDTRIERGDLQIAFLYTNDKEQFGAHATLKWDLYSVLKKVAEYTAADLSVQFIWSPAGGATGDEEWSTDANASFIKGLTDPVGGTETNGKIQTTVTLDSPTLTPATVA